MQKIKKEVLLGFFLIFSLLGIYLFNVSQKTTTEIQKIYINNHPFNVEIADTEEKRTKGLSRRRSLEVNSGMLFIFPEAGIYHFYMKGMMFPLDFVWINGETIIDLTENVPIEKDSKDKEPTFTARDPFDKVLELNAGTIKSLKIDIGEKVVVSE